MQTNKYLGDRGEDAAVDFLKKSGYKVIERNYRSPFGEVDVIAQENGDVVFIEVKLRSSDTYGHPFEAVGRKKQGKIVKTALHYIKRKALKDTNFRFDVLSISPENGIELVKSAFEPGGAYTI